MFGGRDPFANDPFFSNHGFGGGIDDMMGNMSKNMKMALKDPMKYLQLVFLFSNVLLIRVNGGSGHFV